MARGSITADEHEAIIAALRTSKRYATIAAQFGRHVATIGTIARANGFCGAGRA
jgi:hypothetical protein